VAEGKRARNNYLAPKEQQIWSHYWGFLEPSVAQPPLPLQEFSPLHPLSPDLQPLLPLQEFWPLQACFSLTYLSSYLSSFLSFP